MHLETVKSFALTVLIGTSLLLSFTLWTYKPDNETSTEDVVQESTDLGGDEESIKELAKPESVIFRNNNHYYGFSNPSDRASLYKDMQSWVLYNFRTVESNGPPSAKKQVEFDFPGAIPMSMAGDMFTFNEKRNFPNWQFDRLIITFNRDKSSLNITFMSKNGRRQASAVVNNSKKHDRLWDRLETYDGLEKFKRVDKANEPFYIPAKSTKLAVEYRAVRTIDSINMVDIMFVEPDNVNRNRISKNEIYFTDSARGIMRVYPNRRTMEYQNPLQSSFKQMQPDKLLSRSISQINDHLGWTDNYRLTSIDIAAGNTVRYQLAYDNYPVFGHNYSTMIEQQYREGELHKYNRPLFSLANYLSEDETKTLRSGDKVINMIENSSTYDLADIDNIKIGYQLIYRSDYDAVTLEPNWFINRNDNWREIDFNAIEKEHRGG
ncbi:hypothetical protein GCM10028778_00620 [Barrientosiimonas marina]|uniref:YycH family regulatory protein n=1 Tax=Lentibacillus kimchii TaxID=1542911 RepID=A0ABW2URG9_9BACI